MTLHRLPGRVVIVAADWSKDPRKRAVYDARPLDGWRIARRPRPPGGWNLQNLVDFASQLRDQQAASVLVGVDAVLGVPESFARSAGTNGFIDTVRWLDRVGAFVNEPVSPETWNPTQPFFRVPAGTGGLTRFVEAAGGPSAVLRRIDVHTGAKSMFVLSGIPGSVGSGTRSLWAELVGTFNSSSGLSLWPFDGSLEELTASDRVVLGEVYPRAAYGIALAADLPARLTPLAKTKARARMSALSDLAHAKWTTSHRVRIQDLEAARSNEDDFDALMTAAALVRLVSEGQPLSSDLVDSEFEGGILATGCIEFSKPATRARRSMLVPVDEVFEGPLCPIPGCRKQFARGRLGWDAHVASVSRHPEWNPEVDDPTQRKAIFRRDFARWFNSAD